MADRSFRIKLLDEIRGLSIILMVISHICFDLTEIWGKNIVFFENPVIDFLHFFFRIVFIAISGICCNLSKSNIKRGIIAFLCGMVITLVTFFMREDVDIVSFGILHFLGVSMILFGLLRKAIAKIPPFVGFLIFLLFFVFLHVPEGYMGIKDYIYEIPRNLYHTFLIPVGFPPADYLASDYFPLIPNMFIFFGFAIMARDIRSKKLPKFAYNGFIPFLGAAGRYSLIIYMAHQPIVYLILYFLFDILKL